MKCSECGQQCEEKMVDSHYVSDCCAADILDDNGVELFDDYFEDDGDYQYDRYKEEQHELEQEYQEWINSDRCKELQAWEELMESMDDPECTQTTGAEDE